MTYFSELAKVLASSSVSGPHPAPVMRRYPQKSQSDQTLREGMKTVSLALLGRETLPTEKEVITILRAVHKYINTFKVLRTLLASSCHANAGCFSSSWIPAWPFLAGQK